MSELTLEQVQALATRKGYTVSTEQGFINNEWRVVYVLYDEDILIAERQNLEQVVKMMNDLGALNRYFSH
jgi:hypothetical protein